MFQQMINRKNSKKGFTLVEVIVVLVILAILAALLIPSMTKWIDKAKNKGILVEARSALLAAQTIASENYANGQGWLKGDEAKAKELAGVPGTISDVDVDENGQVTELTYTKDKVGTTYSGGAWSDPK